MYVVAELRAIDVSSSHQFEEEISAASSENGLFIAKIEFSIRTGAVLEIARFRARKQVQARMLNLAGCES